MNVKVLAAALAILIASHISVAMAYQGNDSGKYSKHVEFPAIGISLPQPEGFVRAEKFEGIAHLSTLSTIHLITLKQSFPAFQAEINPAALKKHGMNFIGKTSVVIDGRKGLLIQVSQSSRNTKFSKWLLVTGDRKETVLATATCPSAESEKIAATLRSILSKIKFLDPKKRTESENVGFSVGSSSKLKLIKSPIRGARIANLSPKRIYQVCGRADVSCGKIDFKAQPRQLRRIFGSTLATESIGQGKVTSV